MAGFWGWKHRSQGAKSIPANSWRIKGRRRELTPEKPARPLLVCVGERVGYAFGREVNSLGESIDSSEARQQGCP